MTDIKKSVFFSMCVCVRVQNDRFENLMYNFLKYSVYKMAGAVMGLKFSFSVYLFIYFFYT